MRARSTLRASDTYYILMAQVRDISDGGDDIPCQRESVSSEWWFSDEERLARRAKMLCRVCPVVLACRIHGMTQHEWGIWGGLDHRERLNLRRADMLLADTGSEEAQWAIS